MKPPTFVRPLGDLERQAIRAGLRSPDAFTLRRSQILLASADGRSPAQIAESLDCATQTVRNAIRAFHAAGIDCLREGSHRPTPARPVLDGVACERLRALLHRSPRDFGKPTSLWTLELVARVGFAQGIISRPMSGESVRQALVRMGVGWKRAKRWRTSPDPGSTPLNRDLGGRGLKNAGPPSIPPDMVAKPCPEGATDGPADPILPQPPLHRTRSTRPGQHLRP